MNTYNFSIIDIMKEAWQKTAGFKGNAWIGIAICLATVLIPVIIMFALAHLLTSYFGIDHAPTINRVLSLIFGIVISPLVVGIMFLGVCQAIGVYSPPKKILRFYLYSKSIMSVVFVSTLIVDLCFVPSRYFINFFETAATTNIISVVSLMAGIGFWIVGAYFNWAYMFANLLIVEKSLTVWQSLEVSRKKISQHWFKVFFLYLFASLICALSSLTIIGLIWTIPWMLCVNGVLYNQLFGVDNKNLLTAA
jgi:hypothetical protein